MPKKTKTKSNIEAAETVVEVKPPQGEPNVRLAANQEPLGAGKLAGYEAIEIPSEETQKEGWYVPEPHHIVLVQLFPNKFKLIKELGS